MKRIQHLATLTALLSTLTLGACARQRAQTAEVERPVAEASALRADEEIAKPQVLGAASEVTESGASAAPEPEAVVEEAPPTASDFVTPFPGVRVRLDPPTVEIDSIRCLDVGWLEQIACSPGTREHEALVVVHTKPSHIHAALLMAGFAPGKPGEWVYHDTEKRIEVRPPTGDKLKITMRYEKNGAAVEVPVREWIRDHLGEQEFPDEPWIFAGSMFEKNPEFMGPGEHYVADQTGSIIGLVTFGDELIGFGAVIADQTDVQPEEWEVDDEAAPPVETKVTIVITRWE